jgi:hypothetical protein
MTDRSQLAAHLQYFSELGVTGVSKDKKWTGRESATVRSATVRSAEVRGADVLHDAPRTSHDALRTLPDIRSEIGDCTRCKLHTQGRKQIVFGVGNPQAELMFVGEAPGADEDSCSQKSSKRSA